VDSNYNNFKEKLNQLEAANQFRHIRNIEQKEGMFITVDNKRYVNLSSNNYLGIGNKADIQNEFLSFINQNTDIHPDFGSTSSRLLTGNHPVFEKAEAQLSSIYPQKKALIFNSGYHTNIGIISSLTGRGDVIFSDKLNHASIIDGMKLSDADFYRYRHMDYDHLETMLKKHRHKYKQALIVTESVFSMDGDTVSLPAIIELAQKYDVITMVDEAHAFGVFGDSGGGITEQQHVVDEIDIIVGTFGKAIAGSGAFVACSKIIRDYLINNARSLIFTTALPAINIAWSSWVLEHKKELLQRKRHDLAALTRKLRSNLEEAGLTIYGNTQIIPIIIGANEAAVSLANQLQDSGFWVLPIRPPTVPAGTSRLRLSLNADIHWSDIQQLPQLITEGLT
jgi:8-amino-7-oxononanoate synthase